MRGPRQVDPGKKYRSAAFVREGWAAMNWGFFNYEERRTFVLVHVESVSNETARVNIPIYDDNGNDPASPVDWITHFTTAKKLRRLT